MQFDSKKKPHYVFKFPFRFVQPYQHIYETYAKKRWLGKPLIQVLVKQFLAYSQQYFRQAVLAGKITINNKKVQLDYVIRNSDLLKHQTVRQQPPILDLPIQIIHQDDQFLVVNKPPSMIVHTGGGYHYNTLMAILYYEKGYQNLYVLHRIDRLTSGVVIIAKKKEKTTKFHEQSMEEVMKKCYFARVSGNFPFQQKILQVPMICLSHKQGVWGVFDPQKMQELLKNQQIKQSSTKFVKIWYDENSDSSLLQCFPITGRTHQIRVHLQHLGYPILNDVPYGGRFVGNWVVNKIEQLKQKKQNNQQIVDKVEKRIVRDKNQQKIEQKELTNEQYNKWDYKLRPLQIFLHSFRYRFEQNEYVSSKPYWTQPESVKSSPKQEQKKQIKKEKRMVSRYETQFVERAQIKLKEQNEKKEQIQIQKQKQKDEII